ncbi:MAG: tetratricopeptide (TPR) repeat protein [Arenicella sp.]|jgi:tetratricopeptide (TPR) repeat protein
MKQLLTALLLLCIFFVAEAQNIDSLKNTLSGATVIEKANTFILLSESYFLKSLDSSYYFADRAYSLKKHLKTDSLKANIVSRRLLLELNKNRENASDTFMLSLLNELEEIGDTKYLASGYQTYGGFLYKNGIINKALQYYYKSLEHRVSANRNELEIAESYGLIAGVLKHLKRHEEAIEYYQKRIDALKETPHEGDLFKTYLGLSSLYGSDNKNRMGIYNVDSSIHYAQMALGLSEKIEFPKAIIFSKAMLAYAITFQENISITDAKKALQLSLDAKKIFEKNVESRQYIMNLVNEGHARLVLGEFEESKKIALYALKTGLMKRQVHGLLQRIYLKEGDYKLAFKSLGIIKLMNDSLAYQNDLKAALELKTKYETDKKDVEIKNLAQQNAINILESKQKNQFILFGSISFLAILGGIFFWSKQKSAKERANKAEIEQRFLRSQLNPHFIFNALDSIQSYVLKNDSLKASTYMSQFSRLMRQVLENSREKFILLEEEISMLENYMELQKLQPNTEFSYHFEVDDSIDPEFLSIPPMFVQPFVENAIEHGVINGAGEISIRFTKEGDLVNISVSDNGVGLSQASQSISKTATHKSLATSIIRERIDNYNEKLKTNIQLLVSEIVGESKEVLGTKVELKVPFQLS